MPLINNSENKHPFTTAPSPGFIRQRRRGWPSAKTNLQSPTSSTRTIKTFLRRNGKPRLDTTFQIGMVFPSSYIEEAERWLEILSRFTRRKRTNQTNIVLHARHARMLATITECQNLKYLRSGSRILAIESGQRIANENSIRNTIRKLRVQGCSNGLDIKCPLFSTGFGRNYAKSRHSI